VRLIVPKVCAGILALLFPATLAATISQRARQGAGGAYPASALAGCLGSIVSWVIQAAGALSAVSLICARPRVIVASLCAANRAPPFPRLPAGSFCGDKSAGSMAARGYSVAQGVVAAFGGDGYEQ
jgi:hypothetical protein